MTEILSIAVETGGVSDQVLAAAQPGDFVTPIGSVIDHSCHDHQQQIVGALNSAIDQVAQCYQQFKIFDLTYVIPKLRKTVIHCEPLEKDTFAQVDDHADFWRSSEWSEPKLVVKGTLPYSIYPMKVSTGLSASDYAQELPSFLVHEILHYVSNNRSWHAELKEFRRRSPTSCKHSVFEDRIYFIQSVCFPQSGWGRKFYEKGGAAHCKGVCRNAMTEVDRGVKSDFGDFLGSSIIARPYSKVQAGELCEKIAAKAR
ncbi:MAG: hypothetical protein ACXWP5_02100 [Bdellovibrionota bacterium]